MSFMEECGPPHREAAVTVPWCVYCPMIQILSAPNVPRTICPRFHVSFRSKFTPPWEVAVLRSS